MTLLRFDHVSFSYPNASFSVEDINMIVERGATYGLLGKNGSGKSTLLNLIGGHLFPEQGNIYLSNRPIASVPAKKRPISTVFQSLALFPHMTIRANLQFAVTNSRKNLDKTPAFDLDHIIRLFALEDLLGKKPNKLSLGQQQRAAIARSLATDAQLLLLDEPTASLDYVMKDQLVEVINTIRTEKLVEALVIVSHDREFILSVCTHIGILDKGVLRHEGNIKTLSTDPPTPLVAQALGVPFHGR